MPRLLLPASLSSELRCSSVLLWASRFAGWRFVFVGLLSLIPMFVFGGCSLLVAKHGPRPIRSLNIRSHRADVVAELGAPKHSVAYSKPIEASTVMFPPDGKAAKREAFWVPNATRKIFGTGAATIEGLKALYAEADAIVRDAQTEMMVQLHQFSLSSQVGRRL